MARELKSYQLIERSIIKKYRKELWNPFIEAVKSYNMVNENDVILINVENNKKSVLLAKLMQQLSRVSDVSFSLIFIDKDNICEEFGIPVSQKKIDNTKNVNTICFTDVVQKALKSILFENEASSYLPINNNTINPLFCIRLENINAWVRYNKLNFDTNDNLFELKELSPDVEHSIFKSVHAVCLDTIPEFDKNNIHHSFLEKY